MVMFRGPRLSRVRFGLQKSDPDKAGADSKVLSVQDFYNKLLSKIWKKVRYLSNKPAKGLLSSTKLCI